MLHNLDLYHEVLTLSNSSMFSVGYIYCGYKQNRFNLCL